MNMDFMGDFVVEAAALLIVGVGFALVAGFGIWVLVWGASKIKDAIAGDLTSDEKKRVIRKVMTGDDW